MVKATKTGARKASTSKPKSAPRKPANKPAAPAVEEVEAEDPLLSEASVQGLYEVSLKGQDGTWLAPSEALTLWINAGLVETGGTNADGAMAVRISPAGSAWLVENVDMPEDDAPAAPAAPTFGAPAAPAPAAPKPPTAAPVGFGAAAAAHAPKAPAAAKASGGFEIETVAIPAASYSVGVRAYKYPFDDLAIGQSFHIPASEDNPRPAEKHASLVTSATKRWTKAGEPRKFIVRSVGPTDPKGKGARFFRVPVDWTPGAAITA